MLPFEIKNQLNDEGISVVCKTVLIQILIM